VKIHPSYDVKTKTWFLEDLSNEAPTIRQLIATFPNPGRVTVVDYYPAGVPFVIPPGGFETRAEVRPTRASPEIRKYHKAPTEPAGASEADDPPIPPRNGKAYPALRQGRRAPLYPPGRLRDEAVLTAWANTTMPARVIGQQLGISEQLVGYTVNQARKKGDPRAAYRTEANGRVIRPRAQSVPQS
jgi:hypothetical protein